MAITSPYLKIYQNILRQHPFVFRSTFSEVKILALQSKHSIHRIKGGGVNNCTRYYVFYVNAVNIKMQTGTLNQVRVHDCKACIVELRLNEEP